MIASAAITKPTVTPAFRTGDERLVKLTPSAAKKVASRLWAKDPALWSPDPKHQEVAKNRLGWLDVSQKMRGDATELAAFLTETDDEVGAGGEDMRRCCFQAMAMGDVERYRQPSRLVSAPGLKGFEACDSGQRSCHPSTVIARSGATKQSTLAFAERWIASLRSQ